MSDNELVYKIHLDGLDAKQRIVITKQLEMANRIGKTTNGLVARWDIAQTRDEADAYYLLKGHSFAGFKETPKPVLTDEEIDQGYLYPQIIAITYPHTAVSLISWLEQAEDMLAKLHTKSKTIPGERPEAEVSSANDITVEKSEGPSGQGIRITPEMGGGLGALHKSAAMQNLGAGSAFAGDQTAPAQASPETQHSGEAAAQAQAQAQSQPQPEVQPQAQPQGQASQANAMPSAQAQANQQGREERCPPPGTVIKGLPFTHVIRDARQNLLLQLGGDWAWYVPAKKRFFSRAGDSVTFVNKVFRNEPVISVATEAPDESLPFITYDSMMWSYGLRAEPSAIFMENAGLDRNKFKIKKWPLFGQWETQSKLLLVSTLFSQKFSSVPEVAHRSDSSKEDIVRFLYAAYLANIPIDREPLTAEEIKELEDYNPGEETKIKTIAWIDQLRNKLNMQDFL